MAEKGESQISPRLLSSLFARFTADRDALYAALDRCEQRLVDLSERVGAPAPESAGETVAKADEALAIAKEALAVAQEALAVVQRRR